MACTCENILCEQTTIEGVVYCTCTTTIENISCPEGCVTVLREDGNAECECTDSIAPTIVENKIPIFFDNELYFKDVSWTISYKLTEGTWNSYFSFYPDYSIPFNGFFQTGFNWGEDKGTVWNHLMNRSSFCVFQGKKNVPHIEFPVANENVDKMLNSVSLNIEAVHYQNDWNMAVNKDISFKNLFIFNQTQNSGLLGLNPQKTLSDNRKYPQTNGNIQEILFTSDSGKQTFNYVFNRVNNQNNNIPIFNHDINNIFKTINSNAVSFRGKRILERIKGEYFMVHLQDIMDTRYNLILKNVISNETIEN